MGFYCMPDDNTFIFVNLKMYFSPSFLKDIFTGCRIIFSIFIDISFHCFCREVSFINVLLKAVFKILKRCVFDFSVVLLWCAWVWFLLYSYYLGFIKLLESVVHCIYSVFENYLFVCCFRTILSFLSFRGSEQTLLDPLTVCHISCPLFCSYITL